MQAVEIEDGTDSRFSVAAERKIGKKGFVNF